MATKKQETKKEEVVEEDIKEEPEYSASDNIHQRIRKVMTCINYIKKDTEITFGAKPYSVTNHDAVTKLIHPYLVTYGINLIPSIEEVTQSGNRARVVVNFRWVNVDNPEDFFETKSQADGVDNQDKGIGKAWSYAQRYAVLKTFHLETGEKDVEECNIDADDLVEEFTEEVQATIDKEQALSLIEFATNLGLEQDDVITAMKINGWEKTTDIPKDAVGGFKKELKELASCVSNV